MFLDLDAFIVQHYPLSHIRFEEIHFHTINILISGV
jgi:hypothetical protein